MADSDKAPSAQQQILASDLELIDLFIRGKKKSIATAHLQIEYATSMVKLLDKQGVVLGIGKHVNEWQQKILLHCHSIYLPAIQERLDRNGFLAMPKSNHSDFVEYHKYQTPQGFQLFYQSASALGKSWLNYQSIVTGKQSNNIFLFQDNNWYPIQELNIDRQAIRLRTLVGEVLISLEDLIVWIEPISNVSETTTANQSGLNPESTASSPPLSQPSSTTKMPTLSEDLTSSPETASDAQPSVVSSSHRATDEKLDDLKNAIKIKALAKLVSYLEEGETIVTTEVFKNGHDQLISTKTTEIKRNCPRWVIEQIKKF